MAANLFIFTIALLMVIRGATLATKYAARFAESLNMSKYAVGFIVIGIISILPETFVALNSSLTGNPSFGLGMLIGSNIADLTLIMALIVLFARRGLKVESKILQSHTLYPFMLLLPIILGVDGHFSRLDGLALLVAGGIFYTLALRSEVGGSLHISRKDGRYKNLFALAACLAVLLIGAHFIVSSATALANMWSVNPILIGMLVVSLGTTMPEFFFALHSVKQRDDALAIGDVLGTVLADATIVIGILALTRPFDFPITTIYIGGVFMVIASFMLFGFMRSGHILTKQEAFTLIAFWLTFVLVEFIVSM